MINNLMLEEKVELLKELVDNLDIVLTAPNGVSAFISSDDIYISKKRNLFYNINVGTVVIETNI